MTRRLLAIDTATTACSVALFEDDSLIAHQFEDIGRGHAEKLVPMIASLPDKGEAETIIVNCGPGSFTGVRIGISVAKALAFAWNAEIQGYQCLHLIAAQALAQLSKPDNIYVTIHGGHGEYFVQNFTADGIACDEMQSLPLDLALKSSQSDIFAGSAAEPLAGQSLQNIRALPVLPDAAQSLKIPTRSLQQNVTPVYGRAPDAIAQETKHVSG